MIKGAIFDMDGTILDSMQFWDRAGEIYLEGMGIKAEPGLGRVLFTMTMRQAAEYLREHYPLGLTADEIIEGTNSTVENFYYEKAPLKQGAEELLSELKSREIVLSVATATIKSLTEGALKRTGIYDSFASILTVEEVGIGKEAPDIYLQSAAAMGTAPEETLVFEDALHGAKTASDAGFITVGVYDAVSEADQDELKNVCRYYLKDLRDFKELAETVLNN